MRGRLSRILAAGLLVAAALAGAARAQSDDASLGPVDGYDADTVTES